MSFSFGAPQNVPKTTGGTSMTTPAASTGFQFNLNPTAGSGDASKQPQGPSLFSAPFKPAQTSGGFSLGKTATPSLTFGSGTPSSLPAQASGGLTFGSATPNVSALPGAAAATAAAATTSTATTTATTTASGLSFNFGGATSFAPVLGSTTTTTTSGQTTLFGLAPAATTTATAQLPVGGATSTAVVTSTNAGSQLWGNVATSANVAPTQTTSVASAIPAVASLTFAQLEDSINKWTMDLEDQGKFFVNQAKQLNAWDSLLISNGEKVLNLNNTIERVKQQQTQLDQELDFIVAQQKELEELIVPLEKELVNMPITDIDRNQMYQFAEIIDSQLKQISDDLKEIIENVNEANNKEEEASNPITQISKILNAHMNSLQWIDRNTSEINRRLEEITKMQETNKRNLSLNSSSFSMF